MDSSESISFSQDATTDSIDVVGPFTYNVTHKPSNLSPRKHQLQQRQQENQQQQHQEQHKQPQKQNQHKQQHPDKQRFQRRLTIFESDTHRHEHEQQTVIIKAATARNLDYHDEETRIPGGIPQDKEIVIVDDAPSPLTTIKSSFTSTESQHNNYSPSHQHNCCQPASSSASQSSLNTYMTCCSDTDEIPVESTVPAHHSDSGSSPGKKSVLFDRVTVYHFNRSQGFTSVPSQGGSTLGMNRKHFLRRRLSVDMFEEVRRRSRLQILKFENRKMRRLQQQQQQRLKGGGSTTSQTSTSESEDRATTTTRQVQSDNHESGGRLEQQTNDASDTNGDKIVEVELDDSDDDDDDEDFHSNLSDISDTDLAGIFLQPIGVKLRRSLLRASGVGFIDPHEKKDCNKIRDSRERAGCRCVGQCVPEFCECSRLGVKCLVDRVSFPCGCVSEGCKNPEGRTEFDLRRVRQHYLEKIEEAYQSSGSPSNDEELLTTTPTSLTTSEESC